MPLDRTYRLTQAFGAVFIVAVVPGPARRAVANAAAGSVVVRRCVLVLWHRAFGLTLRCTGRHLSFVSAGSGGCAGGVAGELCRWAAGREIVRGRRKKLE
jgi:hypothetical protein